MRRLIIINKLIPLYVVLACICIPVLAYADTPEESERKMDEIKLDATYVYGESFSSNADIAYDNSLTDLMIYCNEIRGEKGLTQLKSSDLQPVAKEIRSVQNGQHTVFLYLSVDDMMKIQSKSRALVVGNNSLSQSQPPSQPQLQSSQNNSYTSSVSHSQNSSLTFVPSKPNNQQTTNVPSLSSDILEALTIQNTWTELKPMIIHYKDLGKITETGNTQQWDAVPNDAYVILFDADAGVLAFLSPKNDTERLNYKTNSIDNIVNYSNCKFIVWYK